MGYGLKSDWFVKSTLTDPLTSFHAAAGILPPPQQLPSRLTHAAEIYSNVDKSTILKSKILTKEIFWDVAILFFSI